MSNFLKVGQGIRFLKLAAAPSTPVEGMVYYDDTLNQLRYYNGTVWVDLIDDGNFAQLDLSNLTTTAINTDLLPDINDAHDLGSSSLSWDNVYANIVGDPTANRFDAVNGRLLTSTGARVDFSDAATSLYDISDILSINWSDRSLNDSAGNVSLDFTSTDAVEFSKPIALVQLASDPSTTVEGYIYYNTTDDVIKVYANGAWVEVGSGGASPTPSNVFSQTIVNNQSTPANLTDAFLNKASTQGARITYYISRVTSLEDYTEMGEFFVYYSLAADSWFLANQSYGGDDSGVDFTITSAGQVQYTSTNITGTETESVIQYKVEKIDEASFGTGSGGASARVTTGTYSSPEVITAAGGISITSSADEDIYVASASGEVNITANPQIQAGLVAGQTIRLIGTSNFNYIRLEEFDGLTLNGDWLSYAGDILTLLWDDTTNFWLEVSRSK